MKKLFCRLFGHQPVGQHSPIRYANTDAFFASDPIIEYIYAEYCKRCKTPL